ncbi:MAG: response regulator [Verrucomicrobia bacterium]|nr:response regulator [Verrucomicrobiota bacterium]
MHDRILLVDDSTESLQLLEVILRKSLDAVEIESVTNGDDALAAARRGPFDLVLLDAKMPGMSGFDVCRRLKADPATRNIPVLMISGVMVDPAHRLNGLQCGAEGYVCKPFERDELVAQVKMLLRMKRYEDRLRRQEELLESELAERTATLRANEEQLRLLFDHSPDAMFVEDLNGTVLDVNAAACKLHGLERAALLGRNLLDLMPANMRAKVASDVSRWQTAQMETYEGSSVTRDGRSIPVEIRATHIRYHGSQALLVHVRDITDRKQMEQQLRRTENLESVGVLAGGIAHDFNNLLTGVLGNITYAKTEVNTREALLEVLGEAERAALRAKSLTQQLLTFAKGGTPVRKVASIAELLEETVHFVLAGSKSTYRLQIAPDIRNVIMDGGQISQVVENIVINADQAMVRGGTITITVENAVYDADTGAKVGLRPGCYVKVDICDQGIGMPADVMAKIFDPYYTTKSGGSGLGLAVSHSIVTKHEGLIAVTSELGVGTTFTMHLPATAAEVPRDMVERGDAIRRGGGRILVLDDEDFIRTLLVRMLVALGYEAVAVADGKVVLAEYRRAMETHRPFDAVLLDLTIPGGMGGEETIAELLKIDPAVVAIVSSGYALEAVFSEFAKHGFSGEIAKPYDMKALGAVLADLIGKPDAGSGYA